MTEANADDGVPREGSFESEFVAATRTLRAALRAAVDCSGLDLDRPQALARHFAIDKSLAWKLSKLVDEPSEVAALRFVPGQSGLRILVERLGRDLPDPVREALAEAVTAFERVQDRHAGDRASLELLALGLDDESPPRELLEPARRQAFLGNSGTWGFQARTQVALIAVEPDGRALDGVRRIELGGLLGFRRLRRDARAVLLSLEPNGHGRTTRALRGDGQSPLLPRFSTVPELELVQRTRDSEHWFELGPGPVGDTARMDCVWGLESEGLGPIETTDDDDGGPRTGAVELGAIAVTPAEAIELLVLLHRDLDWGLDPRPRLCGRLAVLSSDGPRASGSPRLPLESSIEPLRDPAAELARHHGPRLREMVAHLFGALRSERAEFQAWRVGLAYPPIPSELRVRCLTPRS